jgi:predicted DNA-binding protein with PD1-like motif
MKFSEAKQGRIFIIKLDQNDVLQDTIERFATEHKISAAMLVGLGAADDKSVLVAGPMDGEERPVKQIPEVLDDVHEIVAIGTIFPNEASKPALHMHAAAGRRGSTVTGDVRKGVRIWQIGEIVLIELLETKATRKHDPKLGLSLLSP